MPGFKLIHIGKLGPAALLLILIAQNNVGLALQ